MPVHFVLTPPRFPRSIVHRARQRWETRRRAQRNLQRVDDQRAAAAAIEEWLTIVMPSDASVTTWSLDCREQEGTFVIELGREPTTVVFESITDWFALEPTDALRVAVRESLDGGCHSFMLGGYVEQNWAEGL